MLKKLWRWITGAAAEIKVVLLFGKNFANDVKSIVNSPLLDVIVALTPTNLDDIALVSFRSFMADMIQKLNWTDKLLKNAGDVEKTVILHTLSALAAFWKSETDRSKISLQTTLSTAQLVYDASKVDFDVS